MAQNEMIDQIVGQAAYDQLKQLREDAKATTEEIVKLSQQAKQAYDGLGNSSTLKQVSDNTKQAVSANNGLITSVQKLGHTYSVADAIIKNYNGTSEKYIKVAQGVADITEKEAKAHEANARAAKYVSDEKNRLTREAAKEAAQAEKAANAYEILKKEYRETANEAKRLSAEFGINSKEAADMTEKASALNIKLLEIEKSVGQHNRNVGNYASAALALSQILRDTPAFAYSTATGILAISNNIGPLYDAIKKISDANKVLKESGQETVPVWKILGKELFSFSGILSIAVAAVTILTARMAMSKNATEQAVDATKKYNDAIKQIDESLSSNAAKEITHAQSLLEIAKNASVSMTIRLRAVEQLQEKYPDYLGSLSKEAILTGQTADAVERLNTALLAKATMEAGIDKVAEAQKIILDLKKKELDLQEDINKNQGIIDNKSTDKFGAKQLVPSYYSGLVSQISQDREALGKIQEQIVQAEIERNQFLKIVNQEAVKAGALALDKKDGKKGKEQKDYTLKNKDELTKELYDEYAKRLEIEAAGQKAIADDEKKSLEERLTAYRQYAELSFQAEAEGLSARMDIVDNDLKEIDKIEKKSADKRTQQEKELLAKKAVLQQQYNNISAEYDLKEQQHIEKTAQAIVALQQNEVKKRIDAIKDLTANVDIQEGEQLKVLSDKLLAGTIKYKQYTKEKQLIEDKFQKEKYQQLVDYLTEEINALSAQGVNVSALLEQLNAAKKHLYDADLKNFEDKDKAKAEKTKAIHQKINEAITTGLEVGQSIVDSFYQKQLDYQQQLLDGIEQRRQAEEDAINGSMMSDKKKQEAIRALNAQTHQQEKQIQNEMKRIKREQAIADRVASILRVVENTAIAITAALAIPGYGQVLARIDAAIGAAQVAAILAQPLPVYGQGIGIKDGDPTHPGGLAVIGDRPEYVLEPGKDPYFTDSAHIADLKRGTRVIPEEDMIAGSMGLMTPSLLKSLNIVNNDFSALQGTIKAEVGDLKQAIIKKQEVHFSWDDGQLVKRVKRGNNWTTYLNNHFS